MLNVIRRELRANWKSLLFWSAGMFAFCAAGFNKFQGVTSVEDVFTSAFDMMPRVVRVMFGMDTLSVTTPEGYFVCMLLFVSLLAFVHAALLGANILAKEERDHTADFLFVRPCKRQTILTSKLVVGIVNVACLNIIAWIGTLVFFIPLVDNPGLTTTIGLSYLGMFAVQILFLCVGFGCAALMGTERQATQLATFFVMVAYVLMILVKMSDATQFYFLSPFLYFPGEIVIEEGLRPFYVALCFILILISAAFAYARFKRRDLRN